MFILFVTLAPVAETLAVESLNLRGTLHLVPGSNPYYLNNNVDGTGVLVGQIGFGGRWIDRNGKELKSLKTKTTPPLLPSGGAKCLVRLGDYYFITDDNAQGIARFDATGVNAWDSDSWVAPVNPNGIGPESICTDGKWLFTNNDVDLDHVHAFSVSNKADSFALTEQWKAVLPDDHRVRGLSYDAGSGCLYMHNGGDGAADDSTSSSTDHQTDGGTTLYAMDASDGTVHKMGAHTDEPRVYQVLRHGKELLVFGTSGKMSVYDLTSNTTVGSLKRRLDLNLKEIYGAAIIGDGLFVTTNGGNLSAFRLGR
jgi:hypothetical protein